MAAWSAAPAATASSGLTAFGRGFRPVTFSTKVRTAGVRVAPPTRSTSANGCAPAPPDLRAARSCSACKSSPALKAQRSSGRRIRLSSGPRTFNRWFFVSCTSAPPSGTSASPSPKGTTIPDGTCTRVLLTCERCSLAARAAGRRSVAFAPSRTPAARASFARNFAMRWSKSSPPKCASPPVAITSTVSPPTSTTLTSKVPPPRSKTRTRSSSSRPAPYARAAAMGSRSSRTFSTPANRAASSVAALWRSLKYAGTVTTTLSTASPITRSYRSKSARSTRAETSCGRSGSSRFGACSKMPPSPSSATSKGTN
mmetsp:Transcript_8502/g.28168  ORF Transcript_8502/g.28168 Transcript_8502/m.28168 type:complete len:312 (-) Transcript_8502:399-1334(-)